MHTASTGKHQEQAARKFNHFDLLLSQKPRLFQSFPQGWNPYLYVRSIIYKPHQNLFIRVQCFTPSPRPIWFNSFVIHSHYPSRAFLSGGENDDSRRFHLHALLVAVSCILHPNFTFSGTRALVLHTGSLSRHILAGDVERYV